MKMVFIAVLCVSLTSCGAVQTPEPVVKTQTVKEAVATPCTPVLKSRPALMDKDHIKAALAAAPDLDDQVKLLTSQLLLYMGWTPQIEAALNGCEGTGEK